MGYNVIDLVNKTINIEQRRKDIIKDATSKHNNYPNVKLICKVLLGEADKRIKYYEGLKENLKNTELEEIDFMTYDRMSFLINEFNNKIYTIDAHNPRECILFSLALAKDKYSLFIDIQGRLVNNTTNTNTRTYETLSKIICTISKQIETLENTIPYIH